MKWVKILHSETDDWNQRLKSTNASFFQYPYYTSGYKYFFLSKTENLKFISNDNIAHAFASILVIGFRFFKVGLIIRGPVLINDLTNLDDVIEKLKKYAIKKNFLFLRINPQDERFVSVLQKDYEFKQKDFFPIYRGSQGMDFNVYWKPQESLLAGFRRDCRRKIANSLLINYRFELVKSEKELKEVYHLFNKIGQQKKFKYRPYKSYKEIFERGGKENLCAVYTAKLEGKLICATFIVKDANSFNYFSGALLLENIESKFSPSNKLQYLIMKNCFYSENKSRYNLSYSSPDSSVYMFKDSFHPEIELKPAYFTYVIHSRASDFLFKLQIKKFRNIKNIFRKIINAANL